MGTSAPTLNRTRGRREVRALTGQDVAPTLAFARRLAERRRPIWLRYVLVPELTDDRGLPLADRDVEIVLPDGTKVEASRIEFKS